MASESRASYNNNPGNLRPPKGVNYQGQIGVDNDGFAIFESPESGMNALKRDVQIKLDRGIVTPDQFIDAYTPNGKENDETSRKNYKNHVAQMVGLKNAFENFPENSAGNIAKAIARFEGYEHVPEENKEKVLTAGAKPVLDAPSLSGPVEDPNEKQKKVLGVMGGIVGAGVSGGIESAKKLIPLIPRIGLTYQEIADQFPDKPASRMSLQRYLNSQIPHTINLPLSELENIIGGSKIRTMKEVQNALRAIQAVPEQTIAKPVYKAVVGRPGVAEETGRVISRTVPGSPGIDISNYEVPPTGPIRSAIRREMLVGNQVGRTVAPSVGKVGVGALGGALGAQQGYEAFEKAKDWERMSPVQRLETVAQGASAVGGGLAMIPSGITQVAGAVLQAPQLGVQGYKHLTGTGDWREKTQGALEATAAATGLASAFPPIAPITLPISVTAGMGAGLMSVLRSLPEDNVPLTPREEYEARHPARISGYRRRPVLSDELK